MQWSTCFELRAKVIYQAGCIWFIFIRFLFCFREQKEENKAGEEFLVHVDSSTDVGILKFQPQKVEFKDLRAKPEGGENPNKLISSLTEAEINEVGFEVEFLFYISYRR